MRKNWLRYALVPCNGKQLYGKGAVGMDVVQVGIIGCGWFGNVHLDNLLKMERVRVTALVSSNTQKLADTAAKVPQAQRYTDYHELFSREKQLDAVLVCVPPDSHGDIELLAAANGVHLYVEKPVSLSLERAQAIAKAVKSAGVLCSCGYHERYNPAVEHLKAFLAEHPAVIASGQWFGTMPGAPWWRVKTRSGGQLVEQSTHIFDLLRYLLGEVYTVYSNSVPHLLDEVPGCDIEGASVTGLAFESGSAATVQTGCFLGENADGRVGVQLFCRDVTVEYDWMREVRYVTKLRTEKRPARFPSHFNAVQSFINAVRYKNAELIRSPYEDAVKTLAVTLAADKSLNTGEPIKLKTMR